MGKITTIAERLRWNANQTIETNTYIKMYTKALDLHLGIKQKQSLYMIAKILTDGTIALSKNLLTLANHYFVQSENYLNYIPSSSTKLLQFIDNIYGRSKSFHYYKCGNYKRAILLIENTLATNIELEKHKGLEFLVLDRVSQYINLSKIYFSIGKPNKAFKIIDGCVQFLMIGKSNYLNDLNNNYITKKSSEFKEIKSFLLNYILTDILINFQKELNKERFIKESSLLMTSLFESNKSMICETQIDIIIHKWLIIINYFYQNDLALFKIKVVSFSKTHTNLEYKSLTTILDTFLNYS